MDDPAPPPDGEPRRDDRDGRGRERTRFSSSALVAVLVAAAVAVLAVLLGLPSGAGPKPPPLPPWAGPAPGRGEAILTRIDYDEALRIVGPYLPLYKRRLPPFHNMHPLGGPPNATETPTDPKRAELRSAAAPAAAAVAGIRGIDPGQRAAGVFPAVGKVISRSTGKNCTGTMVSDNVMLTADHCLPWESRAVDVWRSIQFLPAYDESAAKPRLYGVATVVRCVGLNPVMRDGRDMAICELDFSTGLRPGSVEFDWPDGPGDDPVDDPGDDPVAWYRDPTWHSVGYGDAFRGGGSPGLAGPFRVSDVFPDPTHDCTLLKTGFFASHGWSGGPVFHWTTVDGSRVPLCAIAIQCAGPAEHCVGATDTILAGGRRMGVLAVLGILQWEKYGFNKSPGW